MFAREESERLCRERKSEGQNAKKKEDGNREQV